MLSKTLLLGCFARADDGSTRIGIRAEPESKPSIFEPESVGEPARFKRMSSRSCHGTVLSTDDQGPTRASEVGSIVVPM
eukprot:3014882-Rhodomonas_salina.1